MIDLEKMKCVAFDVEKLAAAGFLSRPTWDYCNVADQRTKKDLDGNTIYTLKIERTTMRRFDYWLAVSEHGLFGLLTYSRGLKAEDLHRWFEHLTFRNEDRKGEIMDLIRGLIDSGAITVSEATA